MLVGAGRDVLFGVYRFKLAISTRPFVKLTYESETQTARHSRESANLPVMKAHH